MTVKLLCLYLLLVGFCTIWAKEHKCLRSASNCNECLQSGPECAWCIVPQSRYRCHNLESLFRSGCEAQNIYYPRGHVEVVKNVSSTNPENAVALFLQPQELSLSLRPGVSQSFTVTITMPTDRPITELNIDASPVPEGVNITFSRTTNGNPLDLQVNVIATKCPTESDDSNQKQNQTGPWSVHITPRGFSQSVKLEITLECQCNCTSTRDVNSPFCSVRGTLMCGKCECNAPYTGLQCETDSSLSTKDSLCRSSPNAPVCSGRGQCVEERFCECEKSVNPEERYSGHYCECSNYSCDWSWGRICGGHGKCECGNCVCDPGWIGEACSCPTDIAACRTPNRTVCNNHGRCDCGICVCEYPYTGRYCDHCPFCETPCMKYSDCVDCLAFGTGPKKDTCERDCSHLPIRKVPNKFEDASPETTIFCKMRNNEDDCHYYFTLKRTESGEYTSDVYHVKECPSPFLMY